MTGSQEWKEPQDVCDAPGQKQGPLNLNDEPDLKKISIWGHLSFHSDLLLLQ